MVSSSTPTVSADVNDIVTYLTTIKKAQAAWHQKADAPAWQRPIEALILEVGQAWTPQARPKSVRRGIPKLCYSNARQLVERHNSWRYVEGFALGPNSPLPVPHAWAVDVHDRVIDNTWTDAAQSAYFGAVIWLPVLQAMIAESGQEGFFGSDYLVGFPILKLGRIPTVGELLRAAAERRVAKDAQNAPGAS